MLNLDLLKELIRCRAVTENVEAVNRAADRMHGATDARHFAEPGVPIAIFAGEGGGMHSSGKWVSLRNLEENRSFLLGFIRAMK